MTNVAATTLTIIPLIDKAIMDLRWYNHNIKLTICIIPPLGLKCNTFFDFLK